MLSLEDTVVDASLNAADFNAPDACGLSLPDVFVTTGTLSVVPRSVPTSGTLPAADPAVFSHADASVYVHATGTPPLKCTGFVADPAFVLSLLAVPAVVDVVALVAFPFNVTVPVDDSCNIHLPFLKSYIPAFFDVEPTIRPIFCIVVFPDAQLMIYPSSVDDPSVFLVRLPFSVSPFFDTASVSL